MSKQNAAQNAKGEFVVRSPTINKNKISCYAVYLGGEDGKLEVLVRARFTVNSQELLARIKERTDKLKIGERVTFIVANPQPKSFADESITIPVDKFHEALKDHRGLGANLLQNALIFGVITALATDRMSSI